MSKVWLAPTGRLSTGHVLDVARAPFERALRDLDALLYVRWNPKKLKGWGAWEIRRAPAEKSVVEMATYKGQTIVRLEYLENDMVHHVLDCAFLNYDQIRKLKEMDTYAYGSASAWQDALESRARDRKAEQALKAKDQLKHLAKEFKSEIRDFKEYVNSGNNPHRIAEYWGKADSNT